MITESMLDELRVTLEGKMSPKRYRHTVEVEKMVTRLGELYAPDKIPMLRGAALLHDITKEYSRDHQILLCARYEIPVSREDLFAPKTFHARTAAAVIPEEYPAFAEEELIGCVRYHTTGRRGMSLCEQLVYLADYIDLSRTFEDCVRLRDFFFDAHPESMSEEERLSHLRRTLVLSFDMTIRALLEEGTPISADSFEARNELTVLLRSEGI